MTENELELETLLIAMTVVPDDEAVLDGLDKLVDAIYAASDQDTATWLLAGGKRIARVVPVDSIPPAGAACAREAKVSATEFMALPAAKRREVLDLFYRRLHEDQT